MNTRKKTSPLPLVIILAAVCLLPFLGLTEFSTKGEPREAVVAVSMIDSGNWVLPVNNGGDIPYKPPFFHFCIALLSMVQGYVSEATSRMPSALSLIAMIGGVCAFYTKRRGARVGVLASLLLLTSFEVHRAGTNCRVDMMLTACTVGAMLLLYRWHERGARGVPFWAVACMSCAVLTKGPVGMLLPCLACGLFMLTQGTRLTTALWKLSVAGLLSLVVPALWYVAAWRQGGDAFLNLVLEENVGRMTGSMSYDSHTHAFPYNFFTLATGWLPWTLLLLYSLFALPLRGYAARLRGGVRPADALSRLLAKAKADPVQAYTWIALATVFVFYCFPSSKRSVYLLPCYPFAAVLLAQYMLWLERRGSRALGCYAATIAAIGIVLSAVFVALRCGAVPTSLLGMGRHADENMRIVGALSASPLYWWQWPMALLPLMAGIAALRERRRHALWAMTAPLLTVFLALDSVFLPTVMNAKSLRPMAALVRHYAGGEPVYSYISIPMLHFFGANFYLHDGIGQFEQRHGNNDATAAPGEKVATPDHGMLLIPESDRADFIHRYAHAYTFRLVGKTPYRMSEVRDNVYFYRFQRR